MNDSRLETTAPPPHWVTGIHHSKRTPGTVHLIAALVPILPDTVIHIRLDITRHLGQLKRHTHLRILRVEGHGRDLRRASGPDTRRKPPQTVLATRPLAQHELTRVSKGGSAPNVRSVLRIVEPLPRVRPRRHIPVQILDVGLVGGVDGAAGGAFLVTAELELAVALDHAVWCGVVHPVVAEAEPVAILRGEGVAFSFTRAVGVSIS